MAAVLSTSGHRGPAPAGTTDGKPNGRARRVRMPKDEAQ
jgi:hypothetical protein